MTADLVALGYRGSYDRVAAYARQWRRRQRELALQAPLNEQYEEDKTRKPKSKSALVWLSRWSHLNANPGSVLEATQQSDVNFRLELANTAFNREIGNFSSIPVTPAGDIVSGACC